MTIGSKTIDDPRHIKDLMDYAMDTVPHLNDEFRATAEDISVPYVDARDMQLADMPELPAAGESVIGYRFYKINKDGERHSGIFNQYVPNDDKTETSEDGLHFWFSEHYAKAYMLANLKNDIQNKNTGENDYVLERVQGIYKGVSPEEGFLMSEIDNNRREEVMRVTKNDIENIKRLN